MILSDTSRRERRKRGRRLVTCTMCRSVRRKGYYGHLDCSSCLDKLPVCVACLSGNNSGRQELVQLACDVCENVVCTAGGCSTRCTDEKCEAVHCSKCAGGMLECSTCYMPFCNITDMDCVMMCEGVADCQNCICLLCEDGGRGCCESCAATICEDCRQVCGTCASFTCCPDCGLSLQNFCEGCNVSKCFECLLRRLPCQDCGLPVSDLQLNKAVGYLECFVETLPRAEISEGDEETRVPVWARSPGLGTYIARMLDIIRDRNMKQQKNEQQQQQQRLHVVATEEKCNTNSNDNNNNDSHVYGFGVVHPSTTVRDHVTPPHVTIDHGDDLSSLPTIPSSGPTFAPPSVAAPAPAPAPTTPTTTTTTNRTSDTTARPRPPSMATKSPHQTAVFTLSQTDIDDSGSPIGTPVLGTIDDSDGDGDRGDGGSGLLSSTPTLEVSEEGGEWEEAVEDRGMGLDASGPEPADVVQDTVKRPTGQTSAKKLMAEWGDSKADPEDANTPAKHPELCNKQVPHDTGSVYKNTSNQAPAEERIAAAAANERTTDRKHVVADAVIDTRAPAAPLLPVEAWSAADATRITEAQTDVAATVKTKEEEEARTQVEALDPQAKQIPIGAVSKYNRASSKVLSQVPGAAAATEGYMPPNHADARTMVDTPVAVDETIGVKAQAVPKSKIIDDPKSAMIPRATAQVPKAIVADDAKMKVKAETRTQMICPDLQAEGNALDAIAEVNIAANNANNASAQENPAATATTKEEAAPRAHVGAVHAADDRPVADTNIAEDAVAAAKRIVDMATAVFTRATARVPAAKAREDAKMKAGASFNVKGPGLRVKQIDNAAEGEVAANKTLVNVPAAATTAFREGVPAARLEGAAPTAHGQAAIDAKTTTDAEVVLEAKEVADAQSVVVGGGKMGAGGTSKPAEGSAPQAKQPARTTLANCRTASKKVDNLVHVSAAANSGDAKEIVSAQAHAETAIAADEQVVLGEGMAAEGAVAKASRVANAEAELKSKRSARDTLCESIVVSKKKTVVARTAATTAVTTATAAKANYVGGASTAEGTAVDAQANQDGKRAGEAQEASDDKQKDDAQPAIVSKVKVISEGEVSTEAKGLKLQVKAIENEPADGKVASNKEPSKARAIAATEKATAGKTTEVASVSGARAPVNARTAGETRAMAEAKRIADAKAAVVARATARVAEAKAAEDAKKAAAETRGKAQADAEAHRAERAARVKAVAEAKAANEARAAATARSKAKEKAKIEARSPGVTVKAPNRELFPDLGMSLERRMADAMNRGSVATVQAILAEAIEMPGLQKIRTACKKWIKKHDNGRQTRQVNQHTFQPPHMIGAAGAARGKVAIGRAAAAAKNCLLEIFCPKNLASQLIGRGGSSISRWEKESRATIKLKARAHGGGSDIVITGSQRHVADARRLVEESIRAKGADSSKLLCPPGESTERASVAVPPAAPTRGAPVIGRARLSDSVDGAGAMPGWVSRNRNMPPDGSDLGVLQQGGRGGEEAWARVGVWKNDMHQLLDRAGCALHLETFQSAQMDFDSVKLMTTKDYASLGLTEGEQEKVVTTLREMVAASDSGSDDPLANVDASEICSICWDSRIEVTFIPCGHQVACKRCSGQYAGQPCIICRVPIKTVQRMHVG